MPSTMVRINNAVLFPRKRFKCCKTKRSKEHKNASVNLGGTCTGHNYSSHLKEYQTNRIQGGNNIYQKLHRENGADNHLYGEVSNKSKARRSSASGNEIKIYEIIHGEDATNKNQYGDLMARVSVSEVRNDNVNLYQRVQAEMETIGHKNGATTTVEVNDFSGYMYEKLQKPSATEHLYDRTIADGVSVVIKEISGDISYENVSL